MTQEILEKGIEILAENGIDYNAMLIYSMSNVRQKMEQKMEEDSNRKMEWRRSNDNKLGKTLVQAKEKKKGLTDLDLLSKESYVNLISRAGYSYGYLAEVFHTSTSSIKSRLTKFGVYENRMCRDYTELLTDDEVSTIKTELRLQ